MTTEELVRIKWRDQPLLVFRAKYNNGRKAIVLLTDDENREEYAIASVNLPEAQVGEDEVCIKDYSENEGVLRTLMDAGIIAGPSSWVPSGFVEIPICKLLVDLPEMPSA